MLTSISKVTGMDYGKDDSLVPVNDFYEKPIEPAVLIEKDAGLKAAIGMSQSDLIGTISDANLKGRGGAVIVFDEARDMLSVAENFLEFLSRNHVVNAHRAERATQNYSRALT